MAAFPKKTPARPAGEMVKAQNVVIVDSESVEVKRKGTWTQATHQNAANLTYIYSETVNDYLEFKFKGTGLWLRYFGRPDGGKADVSIDGGVAKELDLYASPERVRIAFAGANLSLTRHTVTITVKGTKNISSTGYKVGIDAFIVELSAGAMQVWAMIEEALEAKLAETTVSVVSRPTFGTGKVILSDDFEATLLKWREASVTVSRDTTYAFSGSASLKIAGGTAQRGLGMRPSQKIGIELVFSVDSWTGITYLYFSWDYYEGTFYTEAVIRYNVSTKTWQYKDSAGVYQDIPGSTQVWTHYEPKIGVGGPWHHLKLVVDFNISKYVSLEVNQQFFDLQNYACRRISALTTKCLYFTLTVPGGATEIANYDDVIITEEG